MFNSLNMLNSLASTAGEPTAASIRERGKADRRSRIVDAATAILRAEGVDALSMRALSVEAGVSVPTIYSLVGGRDDVLAATLDQLGADFEAAVASGADDGVEHCFTVVDRLLDTITTHATLTRSIIAEGLTPMLADAESSLFRRYGFSLLAALNAASTEGHLRAGAEPVLIAEQMVSLTAVRIFRWATADGTGECTVDELRAAVTHGVGLLLAGSTTPEAAAPVHTRIDEAQAALPGGTT